VFPDGQADNAQIQLARLNQLQGLFRQVFVNEHLDFRTPLNEGGQNKGQKTGRNRRQNSKGNFALTDSVAAADFLLGLFNLRQNPRCPPQKKVARVRWHNQPVASIQKWFAHPVFQFLNLLAQIGLGDVAASGSLAKASLVNHRHKIPQLICVHTTSVNALFLKIANSFAN
jgi:hypothetical protein